MEAHRDPKREARHEARRQSILDAAERVFGSKDYHAATVEEIADAAVIRKGTVYLYFRNKEDLFLSTVERKLRQLGDITTNAISRNPDPVQAIREIIRDECAFLEANADFFKMLHLQHSNFFHTPGGSCCDVFLERLLPSILHSARAIAACITEGQKRGVFGAVEPMFAAFELMGLVKQAAFLHILNIDAGFLADPKAMERLYLEGLLARA